MYKTLPAEDQGVGVLRAVETEHQTLDPLLTRAGSALDTLAGDPSSVHAERAASAVEDLAAFLEDHLAHEERDALPLMTAHLDLVSWKRFEDHQKSSLGAKDAAVFFPWARDGASPDRQQHVLGLLQAPLRFVARHVWERSYQRRVARLYS